MRIFKLKYENDDLAKKEIEPLNLENVVYLGNGKVDVIAPKDTIFTGLEVEPKEPIHSFL
jgi:hypothetical protein